MDIKIVSRFETFLAKVFGKKEVFENKDFIVTIHIWLNKFYIIGIEPKCH